MADAQPFAGMGQEETLQLVALLLSEIRDRLPKIDDKDRVFATLAENTLGTLAAVTTVTNVSNATIGAVGLFAGINSANAFPVQFANMGAAHIYNNIIVS